LDARNGVAGDMLLAALLDAGASFDAVVAAVEAVLPATVRLERSEVTRAGLRATKLDVITLVQDSPHRNWTAIRGLLASATLPEPVRTAATAVFQALADAEGRAHGVDAEQVHFNEVGAWDSIADVVGVCAALHDLGIAGLGCGVVGLGSGSVRVAHGEMPVPVPAVVELAKGWPVVSGGRGELATPTGMALVAVLARPVPELPSGVIEAVGVGAGTRDDPERPNVVRVLVGRFSGLGDGAAGTTGPQRQGALVLSANVDDLDPRLWPNVLVRLLDAGAADAWLTPILMKKGRPAHTLSVLCPADSALELRRLVFELAPTLGVRESPVTKWELDRRWETAAVSDGEVRIKLGLLDGRVVTATPEFEDVAAVSIASGRPQREVMAEASAAASALLDRP
jgi:uncharacterized protein (TIGR00299 family) protein